MFVWCLPQFFVFKAVSIFIGARFMKQSITLTNKVAHRQTDQSDFLFHTHIKP